ncbi:MAG: hypothetical protein U1E26_07980 [Coriobacteriia bacterium]|nr:hypothetical protein [Coriobacteriia bacterium]
MAPDALDPLETSAQEISELLKRFETAAKDARVMGQSVEGRYVDAYTAGFLLAKVVVRASGYRVKGGENHRDTLRVVPWLMGSDSQASVDALDSARKKRNATLYDAEGLVGEEDVEALLRRVEHFEKLVRRWLAKAHPELTDSGAA